MPGMHPTLQFGGSIVGVNFLIFLQFWKKWPRQTSNSMYAVHYTI